MNQYRITKYNPKFRDANGHYCINEWTDFSDVNKTFEGVKLTIENYMHCENAYIKTAVLMLKRCNIQEIEIKELEIYDDSKAFVENQIISCENISNIIQNVLRNNFWCKLESKDFFIHFGFDYYMYIGCDLAKEEAVEISNNNNLYCEDMLSPYCES